MRFPNGYGSIINLGKKRRKPFAVRITTGVEEYVKNDGVKSYRQKYKYLGYFEKRKDALEFLARYNNNPNIVTQNNITFKDIYEEWASYRFEKISLNTQKLYKSCFNHCKPLHDIYFKDIRTAHLQKIIDKNKNNSNVFHIKLFLGQLYKYAAKYDIEKNYSEFLEMPTKVIKKNKVPYTSDEIKLLWANLDKVNYADVFLILLYTGMRVSELLEMQTKNVNLQERYMFVEKSKTAAGVRYVPIHKDIEPLIKARLNDSEYLITNKRKNQLKYTNFNYHYASIVKNTLGLKHTIHETRHTFISQCHRLELNTLAVKRIVGHANNDITQHYTTLNIDDLIKLIDAFNY